MSATEVHTPAARPSGAMRRFTLAVLAVAWSGAWIAMGLAVADEVRGLTQLGDTVESVGRAADASAQTLTSLQDLPVVGQRLEEPAARVRAAAQSAIESGRTGRESARNLSVLLGVSIAVIPSSPLLILLVLRLTRRPVAQRSASGG